MRNRCKTLLRDHSVPEVTLKACPRHYSVSAIPETLTIRGPKRPPISKGWDKVLFSVCQLTPQQGVPSSSPDGGWGYPKSSQMGVGEGTSIFPDRGVPHPSKWGRVPPFFPIRGTQGYPPIRTGWGYPPSLGLDGGTPSPIGTGWG